MRTGLFSLLAIIMTVTSAQAEVTCEAARFQIENYGYSNVLMGSIQLVGGGTMQNVSLCGSDCNDAVTSRNLSIALSAQAQNIPVRLYFSAYNNCAEVPPGAKPFGVFLYK